VLKSRRIASAKSATFRFAHISSALRWAFRSFLAKTVKKRPKRIPERFFALWAKIFFTLGIFRAVRGRSYLGLGLEQRACCPLEILEVVKSQSADACLKSYLSTSLCVYLV